MKSTPYLLEAKDLNEEAFSKSRTSKVMYMNEKLVPMAMDFSRKVAQITRYRLKDEVFASENYQIMNYGIGGRISMHLDSIGIKLSIVGMYVKISIHFIFYGPSKEQKF